MRFIIVLRVNAPGVTYTSYFDTFNAHNIHSHSGRDGGGRLVGWNRLNYMQLPLSLHVSEVFAIDVQAHRQASLRCVNDDKEPAMDIL